MSKSILAATLCLMIAGSGFSQSPATYVLDGDLLAISKQRTLAGDPALLPALQDIIDKANDALEKGPWSVMDKETVPPSGTKHDFTSMGAYWWPNPDTPDGLPWIHIDGQVNPESSIDHTGLTETARNSWWLALAYYFTGEELYAERAAFFLRTWFIDEATLMLPRIEYGSIIPGVNEEGKMSVATTAQRFAEVVDAVALLRPSVHWTAEDEAGMQQWADDYLLWLATSPKADDQRQMDNNHGVLFDVHVVAWALFAEETQVADDVLSSVGLNRIAVQIEPDGLMPNEIIRANSLDYHQLVVRALQILAQMGRHVGVNLWSFETADGRSMRVALDLLIPYFKGEEEWPYFPGDPYPVKWWSGFDRYRIASVGHWDGSYAAVAEAIPWNSQAKETRLFYPLPQVPPADLNGDWRVDVADLILMLQQWHCDTADCAADLNVDGTVNVLDLLTLFGAWGRITY